MNMTPTTPPDMAETRQDMLEDCLESYGDAIAVLDENGTFVFGNARYSEMFFNDGEHPQPGESALAVVRRIIQGNRVFGIDQMDPDDAAQSMLTDCFSFVQGAEISLKDGTVIQVSSTPTKGGRTLMTFRDTRRDRLGERRAAELLRDGFSSADMGVILWDAALIVQLFNPAWQELTLPLQIGEDITAIFTQFVERGMLTVPSGLSATSFVHDTITAVHTKPMRFLLETEEGRHIQLSTFGITSGGVMATAVDISMQYDAEERARALLRDAVEALEVGVLHFDAELKLLMMNRAAKTMLLSGLNIPEEGTSLAQIVIELIDASVIPVPQGQSRAEVVASFENSVREHQSRRRVTWDDDRTFEISVDPTEMGGFLVSVQDLTEAVKADQKAQEAHELVKTIVDASPTTFLVSKVKTGEVVYATEASRERFGDIKSTLSFFLDPDHRKTYLDALLPTGSLSDYPVRFRRQDGSIMDGLTSARVIEYQGEQMIVSATRDITDFLAMQRELEKQRRTAQQNEKLSALGELLAGVAHELSNPLSVVVGYAMMLRDQSSDPSSLQKLDRIAIAANRCVRIVKMFLALARKKPAVLELCAINELLESAIAVSISGLEAPDNLLELDIPENLPSALADPDHITQVFSNLIVNAWHAVRDLGSDARINIRVRFDPVERIIVIEIQDNGQGVPDDIHHRIFEPFFTTKDVGSGTGVGLAFSHRVVTAHGGNLTLEPSDGDGALFRVCLPIAQVQEGAVTAPDHADQFPQDALRVMVLDDEESVTEVLRDVLSNAGYQVDAFNNGATALEHSATQEYDVIICDMRMPDMDGEGFFRKLHETRPELAARVIFLTGDTMNPGVASFLSLSGQPFLEKPIMPVDLLAHVNACAAREGP